MEYPHTCSTDGSAAYSTGRAIGNVQVGTLRGAAERQDAFEAAEKGSQERSRFVKSETKYRLNLEFTQEVKDRLEKLRQRNRLVSATETIRRALALFDL